eukprot:m.24639 g.24639  ORF g.24639 m.24639 type:complete len:439 (+) comp8624_c0_seq2:88-1404(+)
MATRQEEVAIPRMIDFSIAGSFAHTTLKVRMPLLLDKAIASVEKQLAVLQQLQEPGWEGVGDVALALRDLHTEMQNGEAMTLMRNDEVDSKVWNDVLEEYSASDRCWWKLSWLLSECYMYRRIWDEVQGCPLLKGLDVFEASKVASFNSSTESISAVCLFLEQQMAENLSAEVMFKLMLQFSLWGNKSDLSLMADFDGSQSLGHLQVGTADEAAQQQHLVLCDHSDDIWARVSKFSPSDTLAIVLDNAGFELVTDLCLCYWLLTTNQVSTIVLHGKRIPWFVSDTRRQDLDWTVSQMAASPSKSVAVVGKALQMFLDDGKLTYFEHPFWTYPHAFCDMQRVSPELYETLSECSLIIFKGDLNYRKLVGDRMWPHTTPFNVSLRGFEPTSFCALRTLKSDSVVGLEDGVARAAEAEDKEWRVNGTRAVVQLFSKPATCN